MRFSIGCVMMLLLAATTASAHNLGAECKLRDGRIELEAYFDDDTPARNAKVTIKDQSNRLIAEGTTDHEGKWSFAMPAPGQYEVIVDRGDGHHTEQSITVPDNSSAAGSAIISEGPPRAEFTRTPWIKICLGLALIVLAFGGLAAALRRSRAATESGARAVK